MKPYKTTDQAAYLNAALSADLTVIGRWRTSTCPECEELVRADGSPVTDSYVVVVTGTRRHVVANGAVVIGCQGYQVISPAALGLDAADWHDWTDDNEDEDECPKHGQVNVMDWGSYTGFAGGSCYWVRLSCGCQPHDESNDLLAAQ
jgi:hypothetical protein